MAERTAQLLRRATAASVLTAAVLIVLKLAAWLATGAVSLLASLVDSVMDLAASTINLLAVRYALQPADADHRFGHGKAESLAGLGQATFVAGSALFLVLHAIDRVRHPQSLVAVDAGIVVMIIATVATVALLAYQRYVIRRTDSAAIRGDALHYAADLLTNLGVIGALVLARAGWRELDPAIAMLIAAWILYSAWGIGAAAVDSLMDKELPEEVSERIRRLALEHPDVAGIHDLRTRRSGQAYVLQLHLEMDGRLTLARAHAIADEVQASIQAAFPNADIIIHQDPEYDARAAG